MKVTEQMQKANYNVEAMHGDLNQDHRMRTLKKFKEGTNSLFNCHRCCR